MNAIGTIFERQSITKGINKPMDKFNIVGKETKETRRDTFEYKSEKRTSATVYSLSNLSAKSKTVSAYAANNIYQSSNFSSTSISRTRMECNRAKIECHISGSYPIINNSQEQAAYTEATTYLSKFKPISVYNCYTEGTYNPISCGSVTDTIYTHDHQFFLYSLTDNYSSTVKSYYANQGYVIDAYMIMGIGFGESNASQSSSNPFGALVSLSNAAQNTAKNRAIQALQDCGLAKNKSEAENMMAQDSFYQKAAEVLSYMDNGYNYKFNLSTVYSTANQADKNADRWRSAAASGSTNKADYAYYYYK